MKTPAEIAAHPKAQLHRELVTRLRDCGSIDGAEQAWMRFRRNRQLWPRIVRFGLEDPNRQQQLNRIAFPNLNWPEVDAALAAGNELWLIHELAIGRAAIGRDAAGRYKMGVKGVKIVRLSGAPQRTTSRP